MKKAMRAISIGDKLYNLERIHSKLVHLAKMTSVSFIDNGNDRDSILKVLIGLRENLNCISSNLTSNYLFNYLNSIDNAIEIITNKQLNEIIESFCFMHGEFIKFRRELKSTVKNSCEFEYQAICVPLYLLDQKYIRRRAFMN